SAKFFALPLETKQKAPHPPEGWKHRGYSGVGAEQVSQMVFDSGELASIRTGKFPDFKESFEAGDDSPSARLENVWLPEEVLPGFREYAMDYYWTCRKFQMERLLPALAIGMGLQKNFFDDYHKDADNPAEAAALSGSTRTGDYGTCTILFQDDVGGLEVESPKEPGVFIPVLPMRGAAVFNIGDFLMRWSNDTLKSTLHRVRAPPRKDDNSGMFIGADRDAIVDCLPNCWGPDKPKKYELIIVKEYIDMRLNAKYV
ncbi:hypothetical protein MPER_07286, partial [Moniliophthora perniciosa FA553]